MFENVQGKEYAAAVEKQAICAARPHIERVVMPDGRLRFVGIADAARFLGCTPQALGQLARGKDFYRGPLWQRAHAAYPEIFADGPRAKQEG